MNNVYKLIQLFRVTCFIAGQYVFWTEHSSANQTNLRNLILLWIPRISGLTYIKKFVWSIGAVSCERKFVIIVKL